MNSCRPTYRLKIGKGGSGWEPSACASWYLEYILYPLENGVLRCCVRAISSNLHWVIWPNAPCVTAYRGGYRRPGCGVYGYGSNGEVTAYVGHLRLLLLLPARLGNPFLGVEA